MSDELDNILSSGAEGDRGRTDLDQDVGAFDAPELSEEDYADHTAQQVAGALSATKLFEIVELKASPGSIHFIGRVHRDNERTWVNNVIFPVLDIIEAMPDADAHLCKQFFKNPAGVKKYAWSLSFASRDLRALAHKICDAIEPLIPRMEVHEVPLVGRGTPVGSSMGSGGAGTKGASTL